MKNRYTKKQLIEAISYWKNQLRLLNESDSNVPVISSITEFLKICTDRDEAVSKKKINKQGKVISAKIADKDQRVKSREGFEQARKGDLIVDDGEDTYYVVAKANISKFYEVNSDGSSATGDDSKWKKIGKTLEYYITPFDVDVKVEWQKEPLHASKGYSLVCNDKEGKDLSPVAPKVFADKTLWKPV